MPSGSEINVKDYKCDSFFVRAKYSVFSNHFKFSQVLHLLHWR